MSLTEVAFIAVVIVVAYLVLKRAQRWLARRLASRVVKGFSQLPAGCQRREDPATQVIFDEVGFKLISKNDLTAAAGEMHWNDVRVVFAHKKDLLTFDQNCLTFMSNEARIEANDEMEDFVDFAEALPRYLPGCKRWSEWFLFAKVPAFDTTSTLFFARKSEVLSQDNGS
jgi:hypothetical protein